MSMGLMSIQYAQNRHLSVLSIFIKKRENGVSLLQGLSCSLTNDIKQCQEAVNLSKLTPFQEKNGLPFRSKFRLLQPFLLSFPS